MPFTPFTGKIALCFVWVLALEFFYLSLHFPIFQPFSWSGSQQPFTCATEPGQRLVEVVNND
jgi:hypothetical protein